MSPGFSIVFYNSSLCNPSYRISPFIHSFLRHTGATSDAHSGTEKPYFSQRFSHTYMRTHAHVQSRAERRNGSIRMYETRLTKVTFSDFWLCDSLRRGYSQHETQCRLYQNPHLDTTLTQAVSPSQKLSGKLNESSCRIIRRWEHNFTLTIIIIIIWH
jgi:hypothetical protein